ncbi:MAG: hypothetical protein IKS92_10970 [Victivallales bacterium]|nr:hypothetical protein [Victivallales bacterium]
MKKIYFLLCLCLGISVFALELTEAHEKVIENTVKHYGNILKQDFNANIACPQIFGIINAMLMMQAKAADAPKNVPVPTITSVRRSHNAKKSTDKYTVNWGRQLPKEITDKLSEGIDDKLEAFGDVCSALTLDGLKEIAEYAADNDGKLMQENPNQFLVTLKGLDEELVEGVKITEANICFNKKFSTVDYVKLKLLDGKVIEISIAHLQGGNNIGAVPARIVVKNNLQKQVEGMAIPPQLNFNINYSFQNRGGDGMGMP